MVKISPSNMKGNKELFEKVWEWCEEQEVPFSDIMVEEMYRVLNQDREVVEIYLNNLNNRMGEINRWATE